MVKNRRVIEQMIYDTFDAFDPSGNNSDKYRSLFTPMTDEVFERWMKKFLKNDEEQFILDIVDLDRNLDMDKCEDAAKVLGIPIVENVFMPHLTMDRKNVIVSKEKCIVGWLNIKRTQQLLHKKNGLALRDGRRSPITGQVSGDDKMARNSDVEATMLVALGAENILQELHGPRADDEVMRREMNRSISDRGYVALDELTNLPTNKASLTTLYAYLLSMGIHSDIINGDTYVLPSTIEELK